MWSVAGMRGRPAALALVLGGALGGSIAIDGRGMAEAGEVHRSLSLDSAALGRPLAYSLYLPDAYAAEPAARFPVVYLLHGYGGGETDWLGAGDAEDTLDRLIEAGAIPPLIAVMPDADNSWYVNSAAYGPVETALVQDLIGHVDATYRTVVARPARAVAGLSMGGYGALRLAAFHPELFTAAAALSPAVFPPLPGPGAVTEGQLKLFGEAYGAPFDVDRYNAVNPFARVAALAALDDPPALWLTVGDDDWFKLDRGTAALFFALDDAGVPAELRITDGGHVWPYWVERLDPALRFLARHMDAAGIDAGAEAPAR